jgi:hypothetical protein
MEKRLQVPTGFEVAEMWSKNAESEGPSANSSRPTSKQAIAKGNNSSNNQSNELKNAYKRIDMLKKANDVLRNQLNTALNTERIASDRNKVSELESIVNNLSEENKTLKNEVRKSNRELDNLTSNQGELPIKLQSLLNDINYYKTKVKTLQEQKDQNEKTALSVQKRMVDLDSKNRRSADIIKDLENQITALRANNGSNYPSEVKIPPAETIPHIPSLAGRVTSANNEASLPILPAANSVSAQPIRRYKPWSNANAPTANTNQYTPHPNKRITTNVSGSSNSGDREKDSLESMEKLAELRLAERLKYSIQTVKPVKSIATNITAKVQKLDPVATSPSKIPKIRGPNDSTANNSNSTNKNSQISQTARAFKPQKPSATKPSQLPRTSRIPTKSANSAAPIISTPININSKASTSSKTSNNNEESKENEKKTRTNPVGENSMTMEELDALIAAKMQAVNEANNEINSPTAEETTTQDNNIGNDNHSDAAERIATAPPEEGKNNSGASAAEDYEEDFESL